MYSTIKIKKTLGKNNMFYIRSRSRSRSRTKTRFRLRQPCLADQGYAGPEVMVHGLLPDRHPGHQVTPGRTRHSLPSQVIGFSLGLTDDQVLYIT